ncbi:MAG: alpha/beta hydrolase [Planctomycetota bacterium]
MTQPPPRRPDTRRSRRPPPPYDHPAVSAALFDPQPGATLPRTPRERGVDVPLPSGGVVGGLFAHRVPGAPLLVFFHAGHETVSDSVAFWPCWAEEAGANLFEIDYPGAGTTPGRPSLSAAREAARATLRWLCDRPSDEVPAIVVLGRGIGAALAIDAVRVADHSRVKGMILESGVADLAEVVGKSVDWSAAPPRELTEAALRRDWDLRAALTGLEIPLLVLHPNLNPPFPMEHGELLAQWGGGELTILDRGDRDDVPRMNEAEYKRALNAFVLAHAIDDDERRKTGRF